ncbi:ornithine cyclodeaminase family protein [Cumulibacter soli]|uniref:ornithine cyclodeaminase family protein n=1 Tax=Cumulibacter soli TaxID=2546344 RepID=UPI001419419D|nr:ornithine cyclodeaminase family protein [Cumulibacter soli]
MARLLTDDDVEPVLTPALALDAVRGVLRDHAAGRASGGPRVSADLGAGELTFTAGATAEVYGYRSYDSLGPGKVDQIVACLDRRTRRVKYVHVGSLVGIPRTGAIGGVAVDAMAATDAHVLAVLGSGVQAYWQVWAINAVRPLSEVRVYSPRMDRRAGFESRVRERIGAPITAVDSARAAVDGAQIVVLATDATEPVIDTSWLADGAHVNALGRKRPGAAEYDPQLLEQSFITADSVAQLTELTGVSAPIDPLGLHLEPDGDRLHGKRLTLFQSCGLAGTEVAMLNALGDALGS